MTNTTGTIGAAVYCEPDEIWCAALRLFKERLETRAIVKRIKSLRGTMHDGDDEPQMPEAKAAEMMAIADNLDALAGCVGGVIRESEGGSRNPPEPSNARRLVDVQGLVLYASTDEDWAAWERGVVGVCLSEVFVLGGAMQGPGEDAAIRQLVVGWMDMLSQRLALVVPTREHVEALA